MIINRIGAYGGAVDLVALRAAVVALGPTLLLDADLISGNDGDAIGTWADDSGNGRNFTQQATSYRPLLKKAANGINGHNVLRFDGTDDSLRSAAYANTMMTITADTMWVVFKIFAIGTDNTGNLYQNGAAVGVYSRGLVFRSSNGANAFGIDTGERAVAKSISTSTPYISRSRHSSGTLYHRINGDSEGSTALSTIYSLDYTMSMSTLANVNFAQIDIAEVIIFNSALSAGDMAIVDAYLKAKYATY